MRRNWALGLRLLRYLMYEKNLLSTLFYESQTPSLSQNDRKSLKQKSLLSCISSKMHIYCGPIHPLSCNLRSQSARRLSLSYWFSIFHWCIFKTAQTKVGFLLLLFILVLFSIITLARSGKKICGMLSLVRHKIFFNLRRNINVY